MSLLFNPLSRFIIAFLPRIKRLLISWLQSPFTVILEPKKIKSVTVSFVSTSICHEVMGPDAMIFVLMNVSFKHCLSILLFHLDLGYSPGTELIKTQFFYLEKGGSALPSFVSSRLIQQTFVLERLLVRCSRRHVLISFRVETEKHQNKTNTRPWF